MAGATDSHTGKTKANRLYLFILFNQSGIIIKWSNAKVLAIIDDLAKGEIQGQLA